MPILQPLYFDGLPSNGGVPPSRQSLFPGPRTPDSCPQTLTLLELTLMRNTAGRREVMVNQRSDKMSVPSVCRERGISLGIRWRFLARGIEYFAAAGYGVTPSMTTRAREPWR
jgi:hypothetical protein